MLATEGDAEDEVELPLQVGDDEADLAAERGALGQQLQRQGEFASSGLDRAVRVANGDLAALEARLQAVLLHEMVREEVGLCSCVEEADGRSALELRLQQNRAHVAVGAPDGAEIGGAVEAGDGARGEVEAHLPRRSRKRSRCVGGRCGW